MGGGEEEVWTEGMGGENWRSNDEKVDEIREFFFDVHLITGIKRKSNGMYGTEKSSK